MEKKIGYAFVVGDLFHYGHLHFLNECKKHCNFLIVGVYTDELAASYKRTPIYNVTERLAIFEELRIIDRVVLVHNRSCVPMLKKLIEKEGINVKILFHGNDWKLDDPDLLESKKYMESKGGKLIQSRYYAGRSTTSVLIEIIRRYRKGELKIKELKEELEFLEKCEKGGDE